MSLLPEFELGLWNAWIFILLVFIIPHLFLSKNWKARGVDEEMRRYNKKEKRLGNVVTVVFFASLVYGVFLPLKLWTAWFYVGLPLYLLGMILLIMVTLDFAATPLEKPVTKGGLPYFETSLELWRLLGVHRNGHSLHFLDLSAVCSSIHNSDEFLGDSRGTLVP